MTEDVFRFEFQPPVALEAAEQTLHLSLFAAAGLFGEARVRLEARYRLDEANGVILVDGSSEVGASLVKVYTGLLIREFGEDGFHVRRVEPALVETPARNATPRPAATSSVAA